MLGACAVAPPRGGEGAAAEQFPEAPPVAREYRLRGEVYFHILAAELAGQEKDLATSLEHYLQAARLSKDPSVARRAARIAAYLDDRAAALEASRLWARGAPDDPLAHLNLAILFMAGGDAEAARHELMTAVPLAGDDPRTRFATVTHYVARNADKAVALSLLGELARAYPQEPWARFAFGKFLLDQGDAEAASRELAAALALRPDWPEARISHARALIAAGQVDEAVAEARRALEAEPENRSLHMILAQMLVEAHRYAEARAEFEALLERFPEDPDLLYALSLLSLEAGRLDVAENYLKRLLATGKHQEEAWYYLASIAEEQGRLEQALKWYRMVNRGEQALGARLRAAVIRARLGEADAALADLAAIEPRTGDLDVRITVTEADILGAAGRDEEALALLGEALVRHPESTDLLYARAIVAERLGRLDLAERDLKAILARDPDNATALNTLGYILTLHTDRYEEAEGYIRRALEQMPDEAAIIDSMGWVRYRQGDLAAARRYLGRAWELEKDPEIGAHYGEVLWVSGRKAAARKVWEEARRLFPKDRVLRETMERFLP